MTRIIIDGVEDPADLYNALAAVADVFTNPAKFESEEECFSKGPQEGCECEDCQRKRAVGNPEPIAEIAAPMPCIPCPNRGTHLTLQQCWACWCDVHRGACLPSEVLSPEVVETALAGLLPAPSGGKHRADVPVVTEDDGYVGKHRADVVDGEIVENGEAA